MNLHFHQKNPTGFGGSGDGSEGLKPERQRFQWLQRSEPKARVKGLSSLKLLKATTTKEELTTTEKGPAKSEGPCAGPQGSLREVGSGEGPLVCSLFSPRISSGMALGPKVWVVDLCPLPITVGTYLQSSHFVPGSSERFAHICSINLHNTSGRRYNCYFHSTDGEREAQRGSVTCPTTLSL